MLAKCHNFDQISKFWPNFTILDQISQCWPNSIILTKFHNFYQISQFCPNLTIFTKYQKFDQISQFWQDFGILTTFLNYDQILKFWPTFRTYFQKNSKFHNSDYKFLILTKFCHPNQYPGQTSQFWKTNWKRNKRLLQFWYIYFNCGSIDCTNFVVRCWSCKNT